MDEGNSLAVRFPDLLKEWNYEKNIGINPFDVTFGTHTKVWWRCEKGHEWSATINGRTNKKTKCPYCTGRKALAGYNDLQTVHPEVIDKWNYDKNNELGIYPNDILPYSSKQVWWKCEKGHEWQSNLKDGIYGLGCPYCSNKRVLAGYNDLATTHPELLIDWDYEKNEKDGVFPSKVTYGSGKSAHWKCHTCGYEWVIKINTRSTGNGCSKCGIQKGIVSRNTKKVEQGNSLADKFPDLLDEWNYERNFEVLPNSISYGSPRKVWWKCKEGHEWQAAVSNRTNHNTSCPYCSGKKALKGYNDLQTTNPELIKEWDYDKNDQLSIYPTECLPFTNKKVWWKCEKGHEWQAVIGNRVSGLGCPVCSGKKVLAGYNDIVTTHPQLLIDWDYEKNAEEGIYPESISFGSHRRVHWICHVCANEWAMKPNARTTGQGCPECGKKNGAEKRVLKIIEKDGSLLQNYPDLMKEWNYEKNDAQQLEPSQITSKSNKQVWWKCEKGHEWSENAYNRTMHNFGCPYCSNKRVLAGYNDLASIKPELLKDWCYERNDALGIKPTEVSVGSEKIAWWECDDCGYIWENTIKARNKGNGCPQCAKEARTSFPEQAIYYYVKKYFPDAINGDREAIAPYELDIYIPSIRVGIEYDGEAWHRDEKRDINKNNICNAEEIDLYRIRERNCPEIDVDSCKKVYVYDCNDFDSLNTIVRDLLKQIFSENENYDVNIEQSRPQIYEQFVLSKKANSVEEKFPELMTEWNYSKNGKLKPSMVSFGSGKRVWWICEEGHEWQTIVRSRTMEKSGCPFCSGKNILEGKNDIATTHDNLLKEWDYEANNKLEIYPNKVGARSNAIVWWICSSCEYRWNTTIVSRARAHKTTCPQCIRQNAAKKMTQRAIRKMGSLLDGYPEIMVEWDYEKNNLNGIFPSAISQVSKVKAWWKGKCGHEWEAAVGSRTKLGAGCPVCASKKIEEGFNDFASKHDDLLNEWNYEKNNVLAIYPNQVTSFSGKKVWWKCENQHTWLAPISDRVGGHGCPYCSNQKLAVGFNDLATTNPELLLEWNYKKNDELNIRPTDIMRGSQKKIWWKCNKGHEWMTSTNARTANNTKCPICSNSQVLSGYNDLATTNPELLVDWDYQKNDVLPSEIVSGSGKKVWWKCNVCSGEWQAQVLNRKNGASCPYCIGRKVLAGFNDLKTTHPQLVGEWDYSKNGILPTEVSKGSHAKVWWKCKNGHEWQNTINSRTNQNSGCPYCSNTKLWPGYNDLQTLYPEIAKEWNDELNGTLSPDQVASKSNKKVWWRCSRCGKDYETRIAYRTMTGKGHSNCME